MQERVDLDTSAKKIILRGFKKMLVEATSLKFLTLIFIGYLTAAKIIQDYIGVGAILALLGIREGFEYLSGKNRYSSYGSTHIDIGVGNQKSPKCYD